MTDRSIPMQPRGFRWLRRAIWRWRCANEYRRRLDVAAFQQQSDPWPESTIQQLAEATAQNQSDSNDPHGWAWDSPAQAVDDELSCWSNDG